jgi:hypothetical protein
LEESTVIGDVTPCGPPKNTIVSEKGRFKVKADTEDGGSMLIYKCVIFYQVLGHHMPKDCVFLVIALRPSNPTELKVWGL